ncbi:AMP-binding protein [Piscinibacter sakaiensis]|uniref:AMP-binding protein n=1 Tax=Piscinibacter sakaiensis TaxID=1547922 RepID=UPI00372C9C09
MTTAHVDTFARDRLPPPALQPEFLYELPSLQFPARLNAAVELLDRQVERHADRPCLVDAHGAWSYRELRDRVDRIAHVLVQELGVVPGARVLLRAPNRSLLAACWLAVVKAGAIAVATMPLLRAKELRTVIALGQVTHALCDVALADELRAAADGGPLQTIRCFGDPGAADGLEAAMARHPGPFTAVDTAADDLCILAFTSGTTGVPKGTLHGHRDVMSACACWPPHVLRPVADDVFIGSPPLAFTFGLGGLLLFPLSVGASSVLLDKAAPAQLLEGIQRHRATVLFTAPTSYRALAPQAAVLRGGPLRKCVSAGEALPLWREATGLELIDGIGATELLHIFISADEHEARPGATGRPVPGYRAEVVDDAGRPVPAGVVGQLRVKGPTGCRYLDDPRQARYVRDGWNYPGDAYSVDADGYFHHHARTDDMIVSAGYNIAAPEVEEALLQHPAVAECGVAGVPDEERGQVVQAWVVLRPGQPADEAQVRALQDFVKQTVAPYKYPRRIAFVAELPRTATGKLQRHRLAHPG